jgi:hypothetical protein
MQRTIENCSLIHKNEKKGRGAPARWYFINKCEGYAQDGNDEETCEQCKRCKYCINKMRGETK